MPICIAFCKSVEIVSRFLKSAKFFFSNISFIFDSPNICVMIDLNNVILANYILLEGPLRINNVAARYNKVMTYLTCNRAS